MVACTNREYCDASLKDSVGDNHVCGRGLLETPSRIVGLAVLLSAGNVRARGGEVSKNAFIDDERGGRTKYVASEDCCKGGVYGSYCVDSG